MNFGEIEICIATDSYNINYHEQFNAEYQPTYINNDIVHSYKSFQLQRC